MRSKYISAILFIPFFMVMFIVISSVFFNQTAFAAVEDVRTKSFNVAEGGLLSMDVNKSSIEIDTHNENTVKVMVVLSVNTNNDKKAKSVFKTFESDMTQNENNVTIESEFRGSSGVFSWLKGKKMKVNYYVAVPANYNLDLKTTTGKIKVSDVNGKIKTRTSKGDMEFIRVKHSTTVHTAGGDVALKGCFGNARVNTSDGDIHISRVEGDIGINSSVGDIDITEIMGPVDAITSGGSIKALVSRQPKNNCKFTTNSGSMTIKMANDIDININAKTSEGKIKTAFEVNGEQTKRKLKGKINNGGPELYLRTTDGKITIKEMK